MKDFMMLFHSVPDPNFEPTPEQMQSEIKAWETWMAAIGEKANIKNPGDALGFDGKTMHADGSITDGPYAEVKEIVGGYMIISANSIDEAIQLASGCPALANGGKVEVRDIMDLEGF